ncbi:hypothetical protein [Pediococcus acidilactici]|uniref:hypothetical protein n=1 Tax=Pediococcus acidilactici TaxID=1254 RepID=UPI00132573E3|nr:hypothetical protein [Pediococcus acidilactici]KAF0335920.1 hypothetical protein GBO20_04165 [Pediococcus acidilactici]KAF0337980.1 hypothetical protein GBO39_04145 [Pediococcus acidilactici]KAF0340572.1 hypothetical protein GBO40_01755 [Pediococcus acidilactici]KAF0345414.1 hypothetical protein GBO43_04925 [Pediococcus acidilactici]KAF0349978.1 hypothetical protein GBO45_04150 [Pediococcus acidilactici]
MKVKDVYSEAELEALLKFIPDIDIGSEYTDDDWCILDDKLHDILVLKGRTSNDELNDIGLLVEKLIDSIP